MSATQGVVGFGSLVYRGDGATPEVFAVITEPKDITGPQITAEFVDFTHHQSPSGFRERKPTFKSSGDVTFRTNYLHSDASHTGLVADASANPPTLRNFRLVFIDGSAFDFSAYVSLQWTAPLNGPLEMAVTLSISGAVEWVAPSRSASPSASASVSPSASASAS